MISGIGVDLVDKARFINLVKKFGNRVATKILSKDGKVIDEAKAVVAKKAALQDEAVKKVATKKAIAKKKVVKK